MYVQYNENSRKIIFKYWEKPTSFHQRNLNFQQTNFWKKETNPKHKIGFRNNRFNIVLLLTLWSEENNKALFT